MIHHVDSTVSYTGPARFDRALAFVEEMPPGTAVLIEDGSKVKMLRSVKATGWRLADPEEIQTTGRRKLRRRDAAVITHPSLHSPE